MRVHFILDALRWGFKVLVTDLDIIYFQNPLPYFTCNSCDIEGQVDNAQGETNAGFVLIRPTEMSIALLQERLRLGNELKKVMDQVVFNKVLENFGERIKVGHLDKKQFPTGEVYFMEGNRHLVGEFQHCSECVAVHNNWIATKEAKIYRFKETGLWSIDKNGYYSNGSNKYLMYDNPFVFDTTPNKEKRSVWNLWNLFNSQYRNGNYEYEVNALKNAMAIGRILNRIVILPKFHDEYGKNVSLMQHIYISNFDKVFSGQYREHSFLKHPKLSPVIKHAAESNSNNPFVILSDINKNFQKHLDQVVNLKVVRIASPSSGATSQEIRDRFVPHASEPVLKFHNLYGAFSHFNDEAEEIEFQSIISKGFKCTGNPRQYSNC